MRYLLLAAIFCAFFIIADAQKSYRQETEQWRSEHENSLKSENSWLTVAGLFWLKEGVNTVGTGDKFDIALTDNFREGKFGEINFHNGTAILQVGNGVEAFNDSKKIAEMALISDENGKPTIIESGTQTFYLIKRENRFGIRLMDKNSPQRKSFTGLKWFPVDESYRVEAVFEPFSEPKEVLIPNVLGGNFKMKSPGVLKFVLQGKECLLEPVLEDGSDELFIIFRDLSSKTETYQAGRFLYAKKPENGKTVLDFNRAENPPCAFTAFATCPLPPAQNRLKIAVKAGEKRYH